MSSGRSYRADMNAADFEAAGLYDPAATNAAERLELLEWLASRGVTLETMIESARSGYLSALAGDLILKRGQRYSLAEVAQRTGLAQDRVAEISLVVGLPATGDEKVFSDESISLMGFLDASSGLFGERALLRFLRTVGSSLARMAEAAVSVFYVNVEGPMRARAATERQLAEASVRSIESIEPLQKMIHDLFRGHMEVAIERFRHTELGRSVHTARMTVGFVDLVGFTALSTAMRVDALVETIERFEARAHDVVVGHGGRLVKLIGDEVMFVTLDATAACDIALALLEEYAGDPTVRPRGALASGDLIVRGGDYYGPTVNLASRLAELAVPAELLVTPAVAAEARSPVLHFEPAGKRMLKGIDEPVALLTVERVRDRTGGIKGL
jgi:class 3 adenylate cyclase